MVNNVSNVLTLPLTPLYVLPPNQEDGLLSMEMIVYIHFVINNVKPALMYLQIVKFVNKV